VTKMADFLSPQTADLNGLHPHLVHVEKYPPNLGTPDQGQISIIQPMDTLMSPPLSSIELADLQASETEFSTGETRVYNNIDDLLRTLHTERSRFRNENRE